MNMPCFNSLQTIMRITVYPRESGSCLSRTDFGEVLKVETYLKEVQKSKNRPANSLNKSNPTVEAKIYLQNVFEHDS